MKDILKVVIPFSFIAIFGLLTLCLSTKFSDGANKGVEQEKVTETKTKDGKIIIKDLGIELSLKDYYVYIGEEIKGRVKVYRKNVEEVNMADVKEIHDDYISTDGIYVYYNNICPEYWMIEKSEKIYLRKLGNGDSPVINYNIDAKSYSIENSDKEFVVTINLYSKCKNNAELQPDGNILRIITNEK